MPKKPLGMSCYDATRERIKFVFDEFDKICVSFSGGKDSTVMTHMVMEEAIKRNRKVGLFFIDWECQFDLTIKHVEHIFDMYKDYVYPYWVQIPIMSNNSTSMYEPMWKSWDEEKKHLWIREKNIRAIQDKNVFPFYYENITFEEFVPLFSMWYANGEPMAQFVGLRSQESLNRYRAIAKNTGLYKDKKYTTNIENDVWSVYPMYDWNAEDDWRYLGKFDKPYNELYNRMYQAGLSIHQMRVDEPFGNEPRRGLWLYQIIEPETWAKFLQRMNGVNSGALYSMERGSILGNGFITLPEGKTYQEFANTILNTMPSKLAEHYKNKIAVYLNWYKSRGYENGIPDSANLELENKGRIPSWRRICRSLLKNDYWCKGLGFSVTKSSHYGQYMELMKRRRNDWGIYPVKGDKQ